MGNLLFSPSGRIGPSAYIKGLFVVGVVNALIMLSSLAGSLGDILGLLGLVTFYIFIALGIKRSHDAGKSGWLVITHILLWWGVAAIIAVIIGMITGVSLGDTFSSMFGAAASGDTEAMEAITADLEASLSAPGYVIPSAIGSLLSPVITGFLVNMFNKQDMGDNQYGPVPLA